MKRVATLAATMGCVSSSVLAQPIETITYSVEWDLASISSGSNTGGVYANITPEIGTQTAWNTLPGKGQAATLKAIAINVFNLVLVPGSELGALEWSVPPTFNYAGLQGMPDGKGGITGTNSGQTRGGGNPGPNSDQKVLLLDLKWTATGPVVGEKSVQFQTQVSIGKVFIDVAGLPAWVSENAVIVNGQGGFKVTPTPSVMAVLGLGGLIASRRRRPGVKGRER